MPTYSALKYYYDISKNDFKGNTLRYGVIPKSADSEVGVVRAVTITQEFQIILTDDYRNTPKNDQSLQSNIKALYDKMDDVLHSLYMTKLGVPSIVLLTTLNGIEEPEILEENKVVALRMNISVRYRRNL